MNFTIFTKPVGQMRARACIRGKHAGTFKAKEQEQREQSLAALLAEHRPAEPMEGPLTLYVDCYFPISPSKPKRWQKEALRGVVRPTTKPDSDNLAKHIKDVMTQVGFWGDDKQVVELCVRKWYAERPRWEVNLNHTATREQMDEMDERLARIDAKIMVLEARERVQAQARGV